jgi:hypothetical protein
VFLLGVTDGVYAICMVFNDILALKIALRGCLKFEVYVGL